MTKSPLNEYAKILKNSHFDKVLVSHKNKTIKIKNFYYYRHGASSEGLAQKVSSILEKNGIRPNDISHYDFFNSWPKNSWFEVIVHF